MEYFNIKYVNDGMYFWVKSDSPRPSSDYGLKIITIDLITDKESSCSAPNIDYIDL